MKARGQATAIGAVFFVLIVALLLSYLLWAMEQVRDLELEILRHVSKKAKAQREKLVVVGYEYTASRELEPSRTSVVLGSEASRRPLSIVPVCLKAPREVTGKPVFVDDFEEGTDGWEYTLIKDFTCHLAECRLLSYWGRGIEGSSIGVAARITIPFSRSYNDQAAAMWSKTFNLGAAGNVKGLIVNASYKTASSFGSGSGGAVTWTLRLMAVSSDGITASTFVRHTHRGDEESSGTLVLNATGILRGREPYKLILRADVEVKGLEGSPAVYRGLALFDNVAVVAQEVTSQGYSVCRAVLEVEYEVPKKAVSGFAEIAGVFNQTMVLTKVLAYDYNSNVWREMASFASVGGEEFCISVPIAPIETYARENRLKLIVVMDSFAPFKLTVNDLTMNYTQIADEVRVIVSNACLEYVKLVSIWVVNSTYVERFEVSEVIAPGEEVAIPLDLAPSPGSGYLLRLVTSTGNMFDEYMLVGSEG